MAARRGEVTSSGKQALIEHIADRLEWDALTYDTSPKAWKFNIWRFHDPTAGVSRTEKTKWG